MALGTRARLGSFLLFLLGFAAASCGGSDDPAARTDSGYAALGRSDWKAAQADFDAALAALKPTDAGFKRAKLGQIEALVHLDGTKAKDEFLALSKSTSSQVDEKDYIAVASKLTGESHFMDAIAVLEAGLAAQPESPKIKKVGDAIKAAAEKAGDSDALKKLKGLGYL